MSGEFIEAGAAQAAAKAGHRVRALELVHPARVVGIRAGCAG